MEEKREAALRGEQGTDSFGVTFKAIFLTSNSPLFALVPFSLIVRLSPPF